MKALIAYCYNKSFGPYSIPVKFQNVICRDYVQKLNLIFGPGQGEPIDFEHGQWRCGQRLGSLARGLARQQRPFGRPGGRCRLPD